ncbi:Lysine-specific demethylase JMJ30 [Penicillium rolfsii]|nr:Lysine-specific demethylase JMJ30 [Penicillium rolfsii]
MKVKNISSSNYDELNPGDVESISSFTGAKMSCAMAHWARAKKDSSDLHTFYTPQVAWMKFQPWASSNWVLRPLSRPARRDLPKPVRGSRKLSVSPIRSYRTLEALPTVDLDTFRQRYFTPEHPVVLPRSQFRDLPAVRNWFKCPSPRSTTTNRPTTRLNLEYLQRHAADAFVPLELTELATSSPSARENGELSRSDDATDVVSFRQFHGPLTLFLEWMRTAEISPQSTRLYLAQCQLLDLPQVLRDDFPTPDLVAKAGKGDIYDTNVWIGHPPTYTPLHRDPNPNLFVQLAGQKVVRLLAPSDGQALFSSIRRQLGKSGGKDAAAIRGEEMMQGQERALLDERVWGDSASAGSEGSGYEVHLEAGDGLFIPKGWWHSIKGVGEGVTASVTYRAALFHLSVNPILARASIPSAWSLNASSFTHQPPSCGTSSRFYSILFPQCAPGNKTLESIRHSHTMSSSTPPADAIPAKQEAGEAQPQENTPAEESKEQLYLPSTESSSDGQSKQLRLDLGADGGVTLDHLGPMVVNVDGTLSRIGNWEQMTEIERKNTLRVLGKRNQQRLQKLRAAEAAGEQK